MGNGELRMTREIVTSEEERCEKVTLSPLQYSHSHSLYFIYFSIKLMANWELRMTREIVTSEEERCEKVTLSPPQHSHSHSLSFYLFFNKAELEMRRKVIHRSFKN